MGCSWNGVQKVTGSIPVSSTNLQVTIQMKKQLSFLYKTHSTAEVTILSEITYL